MLVQVQPKHNSPIEASRPHPAIDGTGHMPAKKLPEQNRGLSQVSLKNLIERKRRLSQFYNFTSFPILFYVRACLPERLRGDDTAGI